MMYSIIACAGAAISTDHAEKTIPLLLFTSHYKAAAIV
jgi:hypothetical protein